MIYQLCNVLFSNGDTPLIKNLVSKKYTFGGYWWSFWRQTAKCKNWECY